MNEEERMLIEKNRQMLSLKSMYFNRYLLVRYVTALFFFTNLYWMILLILSKSSYVYIPIAFMAILTMSIAEQVKIYNSHTNNPQYTRYSFIVMIFANAVLIVPTSISYTFEKLYPFLANQMQSRLLILSILLAGILLSALVLHRLNQIRNNEDKQYKRIKEYEAAIK
ncbi:MAG: hypothetical protein C6W57_07730 [Caldibacillus debilis]|jgi:uncharacterized membrane protein|uniref:hypothetical protein n=1 Tax=Caldibacillus debilis TaxID=301148 RepID=UPI000E38CED4|nr:hypothetical protein [Caldibacillus debilis]REJ16835.1 MAG: hypothetical protein C6W57_07730 [Caldibacillus debilis]